MCLRVHGRHSLLVLVCGCDRRGSRHGSGSWVVRIERQVGAEEPCEPVRVLDEEPVAAERLVNWIYG